MVPPGALPPAPAGKRPPGDYLCFVATQSSPDIARIFMESGGKLNAAELPWETDFSTSAAPVSEFATLRRDGPVEVWVPVASGELADAGVDARGVAVVVAHPDFRLNISSSRLGTGINGTVVASVSGQASVPLRSILENDHSQVGLVYKSWLAHSSTVCISSARVLRVLEDGEQLLSVVYRDDPAADAIEAGVRDASVQLINGYVRSALALRETVQYDASPHLTKSVFKEVVGAANQGYSLLHDFVQGAESPLSLKALDALLGAAIACDCCQDPAAISDFQNATSTPCIAAAREADLVANACSLVATYLTSYRSDGRSRVDTRGSRFEEAESWLHELPRSPIAADDCDGSARCAIGVLRTATRLTDEQAAAHPNLRAAKNAISSYYEPALVVLGASAAEATSADSSHAQVAGHAVAMLIPKISLLSALARASRKPIGASGVPGLAPESLAASVEEARFGALFPANAKKLLPREEQDLLLSWHVASRARELDLQHLVIEGTTPSSSKLHEVDSTKRAAVEASARRDISAFTMLAPTSLRGIQRLHVLGSSPDNDHRFYAAFVEATFARDFGLYTSAELRDLNVAASQFVFVKEGDAVTHAGASPKEITTNNYAMVPLIRLGSKATDVLDKASEFAMRDVVAPRPRGPYRLNGALSQRMEESVKLLDELHECMHEKSEGGYPVTYNVALSTLVFNPKSIAAFCESIKSKARSCSVDKCAVPDLVAYADGTDAGVYCTVNVALDA